MSRGPNLRHDDTQDPRNLLRSHREVGARRLSEQRRDMVVAKHMHSMLSAKHENVEKAVDARMQPWEAVAVGVATK